MPEYENEQAVTDALAAAAAQDGDFPVAPESTPAAPNTDQAAVTAPESTDEQGTTVEDSFTKFDPTSLPPELVPAYKLMQADYTRKSQEIAAQRSQYEALEQYGGAEVATEALQWVESLQNPDNAMALHQQLTEALVARGYDVGTAQAVAADEVNRQAAEESTTDEFGEPVAQSDPRVAQLEQQLQQMQQWAADRERQEWESRLTAEMDKAEATLVRDNPHYTDEDMEAVYNLAHSTGFDLAKADAAYKQIQSHVLAGYINQKGAVPAGISGVPATGAADTPQRFADLNDPNLERAVQRYLAEEASASQ